jgi:hypothetical protein
MHNIKFEGNKVHSVVWLMFEIMSEGGSEYPLRVRRGFMLRHAVDYITVERCRLVVPPYSNSEIYRFSLATAAHCMHKRAWYGQVRVFLGI